MADGLVAAQIGCGYFAKDQHGPNLVRNENVSRIKWACDLSDENAAGFARRFGAEKTARDFREAVADPEVDIILVATSHEIHLPIIELAAENGKHIFCEKPMAVDEKEARKIIRAVRTGKVKLCVDYMRRMAPASIALKREWLAHKQRPSHHPWRVMCGETGETHRGNRHGLPDAHPGRELELPDGASGHSHRRRPDNR